LNGQALSALYNNYNGGQYLRSGGSQMQPSIFGAKLKQLRLAGGQTLRDFCLQHGFDPGNYSRLERGLFPAPHREDLLEKYAVALGLSRGSDEWIEFFDIAAASRGEIPRDLLTDEEVLERLPVLFRTIRGTQADPSKLDELVEKVRRT
jgi:transcriptional regulator with XRE-family HTH domain